MALVVLHDEARDAWRSKHACCTCMTLIWSAAQDTGRVSQGSALMHGGKLHSRLGRRLHELLHRLTARHHDALPWERALLDSRSEPLEGRPDDGQHGLHMRTACVSGIGKASREEDFTGCDTMDQSYRANGTRGWQRTSFPPRTSIQ